MVLSIMRMVSRTNSSSSTTRIRTRWSSETLGAHVDVIMQDGCSRAIPQRVPRACVRAAKGIRTFSFLVLKVS